MSKVRDNPLYGRWNAMKQRCFNETNPKFPRYGGRGITIADEWLYFHEFKNWAKENGYQKELTLDRIDTDGNYEPINCRWVNQSVQQNNRNNNRIIEYEGETKPLKQWCEQLGLPYKTIHARVSRGWEPKEALQKPVKKGNYKRVVST